MSNAFFRISFIDRNVNKYGQEFTLAEQVQHLLDMLADTLSADIFIGGEISYMNALSIVGDGNKKNSELNNFLSLLSFNSLPKSEFFYPETLKKASDNMRIKHTTDIKRSINRAIQYKSIDIMFKELSLFIKRLEEFNYNYRITKYVYYND